MSNAAMWTAIIGSCMALILALRSMRNLSLGSAKTMQYALLWLAIIVGLTLVIGYIKP